MEFERDNIRVTTELTIVDINANSTLIQFDRFIARGQRGRR